MWKKVVTVLILLSGLLIAYKILRNEKKQISTKRHAPVSLELISKVDVASVDKATDVTSLSVDQPPPPRPVVTENDILKMASQDRLCLDQNYNEYLLENYTFKSDEQRKYLILKSLAAANGRSLDPCLMALFSRSKDQSLFWAQKSNSTNCKTIRALLYTDQMSFSKGKFQATDDELSKGLKLFDELQNSDKNGFFVFFKLYPLEKLNRSIEIEEEISLFFEIGKFENPLLELQVVLRELGSKNGTSFVLSSELYSSTDVPDFQKSSEIVRKWLKTNHHDNAMTWVENWLAKIDHLINIRATEPFVPLIEISTFKDIARSIAQNESPQALEYPVFQQERWVEIFRQFTDLDSIENLSWDNQSTCNDVYKMSTQNYFPFLNHFKKMQSTASKSN